MIARNEDKRETWRTPLAGPRREAWEEVTVHGIVEHGLVTISRRLYGHDHSSTEQLWLTYDQARYVLDRLADELGCFVAEQAPEVQP